MAAGHNEHTTDRTEAINQLLRANGTALGRKRGKPKFLPHMYVIRDGKNEKVGLCDATLPECIATLCRMCKDTAASCGWKEPITENLHQLATMASTWDWEMSWLWSEHAFTMIDDGRLPQGWTDQYAIKYIQCDACAVGAYVNTKKHSVTTIHNPEDEHRGQQQYS